MKTKLANSFYFLKEIISPKYCLVCFNYTRNYFCFDCVNRLNFRSSFNCLECDRRVSLRCPIKGHSELIKFLISFGSYENKFLREIVILGKEKAYEIFSDLGFYVGQELKNYNFNDYFLVPVPLSRGKLLKRGFNQSEILAIILGKEINLKIFKGLLKIKETEDQNLLDYKKRLVNLEGAFALKEKPPLKVILIDDVKTTGATLKECAKVLKRGGSKEIIALTFLK